MSGDRQVSWSAILDIAMKVGLPISLGISGWTFSQLWDHGNRLTAIENSRYTRGDAEASLLRFRSEVGLLGTKIDAMTDSVIGLREDVARQGVVQSYNNTKMDEIREAMDELKESVRDR